MKKTRRHQSPQARKRRALHAMLRRLPSVDEALRDHRIVELAKKFPRTLLVSKVREVIAEARETIRSGNLGHSEWEAITRAVPQRAEQKILSLTAPTLRPVINATGVIGHTNLGRSPLADAALEQMQRVARGYSNLELDLESGKRGKRDVHVEALLLELLPAEAAIVVNNNAAAMLLALNTLAEGHEVLVSRGELIEIGESFRIPDILRKSGAVLREIGTTNRTRLKDYTNAIRANTRLLLRVHRSNFEIVGFTERPSLEEMVGCARKHRLPLYEDLGSGCLVDLSALSVAPEPRPQESLRAGVDVVSFSGDKMLGGPQAGILAGRKKILEPMRRNPLYRALRLDKIKIAALSATLRCYLLGTHREALPLFRLLSASVESLGSRARAIIAHVRPQNENSTVLNLEVVEGKSVIGGGAMPTGEIPTRLITLRSKSHSVNEMEKFLRAWDPPILARIERNQLQLDLRTVFPEEDLHLGRALSRLSDMR